MALFFILLLAPPDEGTLTTSSGSAITAREISIVPEGGALVVRYSDISGANHSIKAEELVELSLAQGRTPPVSRPSAEDVEAILTTGDILAGRIGPKAQGGIQISSSSYGNHTVKLDYVRAVLFPANKAFYPRTPPGRVDSDLILTKDADRKEGTLQAISAAGLVYRSKRLERDVELALVQCVGVWLVELPPGPPREPATLFSIIHTADGSSVRGSIQSLQQGVLSFTDLYGTSYKVPADQVAAIYMKNGRVVYLSDMEPASVQEDANFIRAPQKLASDLEYPFQRDRSAKGTRIVLGGTEHRKGLGVRAHSQLTYALAGAYKRFQAVVGLDAVSMGLGAVAAEVWVDGKKVKEALFRRNDPPLPIDIDLSGAKELRLTVTWAGAGQSDFADWASARLIR